MTAAVSVMVMIKVRTAQPVYNPRVEWWVWLAFGLVLLVVELATPSGFFVMFFGVGALTVGLLTAFALAGPAWTQWLIFTLVSVGYLLLFRDRVRGVARPPANIDTLIGELAIPRERILPGQFGRVDLRGTLWNARNDASTYLEPGQRCRVTGVDEGLVVFVQPE
jgi:membrane protein implicated in regulation of membrane protease activity